MPDQTLCRALAEAGLSLWRRPLRKAGGNRQFLLTLAAEGGLPLSLLAAGHGAFAAYLRAVTEDCETFALGSAEDVAEVARAHDHNLPQSFRQDEVRQVTAELALWLFHARAAIPDMMRRADPLGFLKEGRPDLLAGLPLRLGDAAAEALLREELAVAPGRRRTTGHELCTRVLFRNDGTWRIGVAFAATTDLSATGPEAGLLRLLDDCQSARLMLSGAVARAGRSLVLSLSKGAEGWSADRLSAQAVVAPVACGAAVEAEVMVDGRSRGVHVLLSAREPSGPEIWRAADAEGRQLVLVPSRLVDTRHAALWLTCRAGLRPEPGEGIVLEAEPGESDNLALWRIAGSGRIAVGDASFRVRTGADAEHGERIWYANRALPGAQGHAGDRVLRGVPDLWRTRANGQSQRVPATALFWRAAGTGGWESFARCPPSLGRIEVELRESGDTIDRLRMTVVPEMAQVRAVLVSGSRLKVAIAGLHGASRMVARLGAAQVEAMVESGAATLELAETSGDGIALDVLAAGPGAAPLRLTLPRPARAPGFVDTHGRAAATGARVATAALAGWRAVAPPDMHAVLEVRISDRGTRFSFNRQFEENRALLDLAEEAETIIAAANPDAVVELRVYAGGQESLPLRLPRHSGSLTPPRDGLISLDADAQQVLRSDGTADIGLHALNMHCPGLSVFLGRWTVDSLQGLDLANAIPPGRGPWLIAAECGGGQSIRPTVHFGSDPVESDGPSLDGAFKVASSLSTREARIEALGRALQELLLETRGVEWPVIEDLFHRARALGVLPMLDLVQALGRSPASAALLLIRSAADPATASAMLRLEQAAPVMWACVAQSDWNVALNRFREDLMADLAAFGPRAATFAAEAMIAAAREIAAQRPELSACLVRALLCNGVPLIDAARAFPALSVPDPHRSLRHAMAGAVQRNGEGRERYPGGGPVDHPAAGQLAAFDPDWRGLLAAPLRAALIAAGAPARPGELLAIAALRAADPYYFADALPFAVLLTEDRP